MADAVRSPPVELTLVLNEQPREPAVIEVALFDEAGDGPLQVFAALARTGDSTGLDGSPGTVKKRQINLPVAAS